MFSDTNECSSSPCKNNATCQDSINGYVCLCLSGFTGNYCETGAIHLCCYFQKHYQILNIFKYLPHVIYQLGFWFCVTYWFAPCKRIHEGPGFRISASRFRIPASGFCISTLWIPDSIPKWIPDSSVWIPDSNSKNLLHSAFRILLDGAILIRVYIN